MRISLTYHLYFQFLLLHLFIYFVLLSIGSVCSEDDFHFKTMLIWKMHPFLVYSALSWDSETKASFWSQYTEQCGEEELQLLASLPFRKDTEVGSCSLPLPIAGCVSYSCLGWCKEPQGGESVEISGKGRNL